MKIDIILLQTETQTFTKVYSFLKSLHILFLKTNQAEQ